MQIDLGHIVSLSTCQCISSVFLLVQVLGKVVSTGPCCAGILLKQANLSHFLVRSFDQQLVPCVLVVEFKAYRQLVLLEKAARVVIFGC